MDDVVLFYKNKQIPILNYKGTTAKPYGGQR